MTAFGLGPLRELAWPVTSYLAEQFLAAGFVPLGGTNVPEFGTTVTTDRGASRLPATLGSRPFHRRLVGRSAAAVASGMVRWRTRTTGAVHRIPASECGLVGLSRPGGG